MSTNMKCPLCGSVPHQVPIRIRFEYHWWYFSKVEKLKKCLENTPEVLITYWLNTHDNQAEGLLGQKSKKKKESPLEKGTIELYLKPPMEKIDFFNNLVSSEFNIYQSASPSTFEIGFKGQAEVGEHLFADEDDEDRNESSKEIV